MFILSGFTILHFNRSVWVPRTHAPANRSIASLSNFSHSNECVVAFHCGFNLQFSDDQPHWVSFHGLTDYLHNSFGEESKSFAHF